MAATAPGETTSAAQQAVPAATGPNIITAEAPAVSNPSPDSAAAYTSPMPWPFGVTGSSGAPTGPNPYDQGQPSSSLQRMTSDKYSGSTGALNATQAGPASSDDTYVTVPVDKVVVASSNVGKITPSFSPNGSPTYSSPTKAATPSTGANAKAVPRQGGNPPASQMPPTIPTVSRFAGTG